MHLGVTQIAGLLLQSDDGLAHGDTPGRRRKIGGEGDRLGLFGGPDGGDGPQSD